ncbi:MAG: hypothetical protein FWG34_15400 [Oscillospiraceae bacterium]|nr:hypothetical protein [Oscillospiraceae bacterium]
MDINNPWQKLPHDTYEKHMGHENVRQLEMLSLRLAVPADAPDLAD